MGGVRKASGSLAVAFSAQRWRQFPNGIAVLTATKVARRKYWLRLQVVNVASDNQTAQISRDRNTAQVWWRRQRATFLHVWRMVRRNGEA